MIIPRFQPHPLGAGLVCAALALAGCKSQSGGPVSEVRFAAMAGDEPFSCTKKYELGTPATEVSPLDLRMYVYDLELIRKNGSRVPFELGDDGAFQGDGVGLLDFANRSGSCSRATAATHVALTGSAEAHDDYTGLAFRIGVPNKLNHLDHGKQSAPLDLTSLFWSWQDGHIFLRTSWQSAAQPEWEFSLGESVVGAEGEGCQGSDKGGYSCPPSFAPAVELDDFDIDHDTVKVDLAELFKGVDFSRVDYSGFDEVPSADPAANAKLDYTAGCHMDQYDAECSALLDALGVDYLNRGEPDATKQRVFSKK